MGIYLDGREDDPRQALQRSGFYLPNPPAQTIRAPAAPGCLQVIAGAIVIVLWLGAVFGRWLGVW